VCVHERLAAVGAVEVGDGVHGRQSGVGSRQSGVGSRESAVGSRQSGSYGFTGDRLPATAEFAGSLWPAARCLVQYGKYLATYAAVGASPAARVR
jgi:hypothetical protein